MKTFSKIVKRHLSGPNRYSKEDLYIDVLHSLCFHLCIRVI